jgi:hypothetical protein
LYRVHQYEVRFRYPYRRIHDATTLINQSGLCDRMETYRRKLRHFACA